MVVDYDKDRLSLSATKYWQTQDESFRIDRNYADSGVWRHEIPAGALAQMNRQVLSVYDTLFDGLPGLDSHLIGYSTSTHAPKQIEDIFVMPTLTYRMQSDNQFNPINTQQSKPSNSRTYVHPSTNICSSAHEHMFIASRTYVHEKGIISKTNIDYENNISI